MHITVLRTLHFSKCLINIFHWQELVEAYAAEAKSSGKPQLMLTAAVSAGKGTIDAGYEIAKYCRFLLNLIVESVFVFDERLGFSLSSSVLYVHLQASGLH